MRREILVPLSLASKSKNGELNSVYRMLVEVQLVERIALAAINVAGRKNIVKSAMIFMAALSLAVVMATLLVMFAITFISFPSCSMILEIFKFSALSRWAIKL
jgi:hypothetical protein